MSRVAEQAQPTVPIFAQLESQVRSYCRSWPAVFRSAAGSYLYDESGRRYLDFFTGAGVLNYGHNHPRLKQALLDYLASDAIVHALDMHTVAKRAFLQTFRDVILKPRGLDYRVQFPGPTGTNAVEAALKLARKYTGRRKVVTFTNAFHGMTLGALAVSGNAARRRSAGVPLGDVAVARYDRSPGADPAGHDAASIDALLDGDGGSDVPAAVIVETVQGEGGVHVASWAWLRDLAARCRRRGVLLIVDDVQMGCGRTGPFFSFEPARIVPDIVCLSKAISGYGLPLALTLLRPELDVWQPGEHNGTFRGNNPAFVTGTAALAFWRDGELEAGARAKAEQLRRGLDEIVAAHRELGAVVRGRGLVWGIALRDPAQAAKICAAAFDRGLLMETSGAQDEVVKLLPPLTATARELQRGLDILADSISASVDVP